MKSLRAIAFLLALASNGCVNDPDESSADGGAGGNAGATEPHEITVRAPAALAVDFLFVVDDSGSMCEEQKSLAHNFAPFADYLASAGVDYRIAVTSTDLRSEGRSGRLLSAPTPPVPALNCTDAVTGEPDVPDTADCPADLPVVLGPDADPASLARDFRCLVTLGTGGDGFEKGLEAMRLALACDGPNAPRFASCCEQDEYVPACPGAAAQAPEFLRPDAMLAVVFLTDENDCSEPASNPTRSRLAICKYGPVDGDGDRVPDGYLDRELCAGAPAACFHAECGDRAAVACHAQRCTLSRGENSNCEWHRDELTPVSDYVDFLRGLKAGGGERIYIGALAGERAFTEAGDEVHYNAPAEPRATPAACDANSPEYDPSLTMDVCCPGGVCEGPVQPTCSSQNGLAFSGYRYLELAEAFGAHGEAASICVDDLGGSLQRVVEQLPTERVVAACLDRAPACRVGRRPCGTDAERADAGNYALAVECQGGCADPVWEVETGRADCGGGVAVRFTSDIPPGATVVIRYDAVVE